MKFLPLKRPPKVRSTWRAILAGAIAYCLSLLFFTVVYAISRDFVWAAMYSEPYHTPPGPLSPNSGEWLFVQGFGFCTSIIAGVFVAHWSAPSSKLPIVALVICSVAILLFTDFPLDTSPIRNALHALHTPVGLLVGASLLRGWQAAREPICS